MTLLARFSSKARPEDVRGCLDAYYRLRDEAVAMRSDLAAQGASLAERIAMTGVIAELDEGIAAAHRWLSRYARRVSGAGQSPAVTVAVSGQGCAASAPSVGLALRAAAREAVTP